MGEIKMFYNDPDYMKYNKETGELSELRTSTVLPLEEFIMVYLRNIPEMYSLEGNHIKVLMHCWRYCMPDPYYPDYNIIIPGRKAFKDTLRDSNLNLTDKSVSVYISQLADRGFLIRVDRGIYALNPKFFYKGRTSARSKLMLTLYSGYTREELEQMSPVFPRK